MSLTDEYLQQAGVGVEHHFVADEVYLKRAFVAAGTLLRNHSHSFDHASALVSGEVELCVEGVCRKVAGPTMLLIESGKSHSITALTDAVWYCIHITNDVDPKSVDATILKG